MTSSLLTVNVSFTLVNCGSPDTCMCDKNVGPQLRLVLGGDIKDNGLSYEAAVIEDALHTFQNYHGSVMNLCAQHFYAFPPLIFSLAPIGNIVCALLCSPFTETRTTEQCSH